METAFKAVAIVGFKDGQGGVEHLALGHNHNVEPGRDVVVTKNLSNQSFSLVPLNGSAEFFRRRDAQTSDRPVVGQDEHGRKAPVDPYAAFIDFLKLGAAADVFMRPEPRQISLFAADGQALAAFRPAALQHQPPVFRAHTDQKPVRLCAVASVRLERADTFHAFTPDAEPTMLATTPESVNRSGLCYSRRPSNQSRVPHAHARLVSSQSFPHLWKKLWKFAEMMAKVYRILFFLAT